VKRGDRVLVTGGAGFLGSHLCEALAAEHRVVVLDDFSTGLDSNLRGLGDGVEVHRGSVLEREAVDKAVRGCTAVFHLAALTSAPESLAQPQRYSQVNFGGTDTVLDAAVRAGARRFVLFSSAAVYGDLGEEQAREDGPVRPLSPYGVTKLAAEGLCRAYSKEAGIAATALRFFNIYGPRQRADSQYASVIPLFIRLLLRREAPTIYGDGEQTRDFIHTRDAVRFAMAAARTDPGKVSGRVFNVGSGVRVTVNEVYDILRRLTGSGLEARHAPPRDGEIRHSVAKTTAAQEAMEVSVSVPLESGLAELVESMRGSPA
jgi:UDP-glucose 4-epimerase